MAEHAPLSPHCHPGAVVTIRDLRVGFGNHPAVNGVDLELQPGALHVLLGPSGAGKTAQIFAHRYGAARRATAAGSTGPRRRPLGPDDALVAPSVPGFSAG